MTRGIVAAGHPLTAQAGAEVLRAGGNAVDAAIAAMLTSWVCEPLLTGPGAGGYMLVAPPGGEPVALDFFVEAGGRGGVERTAELVPVEVDFGDTTQLFNGGVASVGAYGVPAGIECAHRRFGTLGLDVLAAPAAELAHQGVPLTGPQAFILELLGRMVRSTPEAAALFAPSGKLLGEGERWVDEELGAAIERFGAEGAAPFYTGEAAHRVVAWVRERGGTLTLEDLAAYEALERPPVRVAYRGREVLTTPPSSAGGLLIARALALLEAERAPPDALALLRAMRGAQSERTPEFLAGLADPEFAASFCSSRLGATTHISVMDGDGWACGTTCSIGTGSGVVVPGTGMHLNNMLGEQDLNPLGFHTYPPERRLPSMMSPTLVLRGGVPELVVGSAGSNRIRSAILQVVVNVVDRGMHAEEAVEAPRLHFEDGEVWAEPGLALEDADVPVTVFRDLNMFFGGAQAAQRDPETGSLSGGGDPRRGGAVVCA